MREEGAATMRTGFLELRLSMTTLLPIYSDPIALDLDIATTVFRVCARVRPQR